jgi:hypothetical protein
VREEFLPELGVAAFEDGAPRVGDEALVEVHVVHGGEDGRQDLVRGEEMVQVSAREAPVQVAQPQVGSIG